MDVKPGYLTAYLAGFFDADGHIGIAPPRDTSIYLLHVDVNQVVVEPLMLFKQEFGGKVIGPLQRKAENSRPIYRWSAETKVAEDALRAMLPWLVVKRERATLALEFRELFSGANILPRGLTVNHAKRERIVAQRHECYARMRVLNKRGL